MSTELDLKSVLDMVMEADSIESPVVDEDDTESDSTSTLDFTEIRSLLEVDTPEDTAPVEPSMTTEEPVGTGPTLFPGAIDYLPVETTGQPATVVTPEGEEVPKPDLYEPSFWRELKLGIDRGMTDIGYLRQLDETYSKEGILSTAAQHSGILGKGVLSLLGAYESSPANGKYGADFASLNSDQRRERIKQVKEANLKAAYADVYEAGREDAATVHVGEFLKTMWSPTTLVGAGAPVTAGLSLAAKPLVKPLASIVKSRASQAATVAGAWAAEYNVLRQLAEEGKISPTELAAHTAAGVAGGLTLFGLFTAVGKGGNAVHNKLADRASRKRFDKALDDPVGFEKEIHRKMYEQLIQYPEGSPAPARADALAKVYKESGLTLDQMLEVEKKLGHMIAVPTKREAELFFDAAGRPKHPYQVGGFEFIRDTFIPIYDRVREVSQRVHGKLMQYEYHNHKIMARREDYVHRLIESSHKALSEEASNIFWNRLSHQKWDEAISLVHSTVKNPKAVQDLETLVRTIYREMDTMAEDAIRNKVFKRKDKIDNYFPHRIRYVDELMDVMGKGIGENTDSPATKLMARLNKDAVTDLDKSNALNAFLMGKRRMKGEHNISFSKERGFMHGPPSRFEVDLSRFPDQKAREAFIKANSVIIDGNKAYVNLNQYYYSPQEALTLYMRQMTDEINIRDFFGVKYLKFKGDDPRVDALDVGETIGAHLKESMKYEYLTSFQLQTLRKMLDARFNWARRPASNSLRAIKDVTYATLLGNPNAAMTQFGDIAAPMYKSGVWNTAKSVSQLIMNYPRSLVHRAQGKPPAQMFDSEINLGLRNSFFDMDDFITKGGVYKLHKADSVLKLLNKTSNWSMRAGFRQADKMGKNATQMASFNKAASELSTEKGTVKWLKENAPMFGIEDAHEIARSIRKVAAIRKEKGTLAARDAVDDWVNLYNFAKLSDVQPITLGGGAYNHITGGSGSKLLYVLGSFVIRQMGLWRNDITNKLISGDPKQVTQGAYNMGKWVVFYGTMGIGVDQIKKTMLLGETDFKPSDIWEDPVRTALTVGASAARTFNLTPYTMRQMSEGESPMAQLFDIVLQPASLALPGAAWKAYIDKDKEVTSYSRLAAMTPGVGPLMNSTPLNEALQHIPYIGDFQGSLASEAKARYNRNRIRELEEDAAERLGTMAEDAQAKTRKYTRGAHYQQLEILRKALESQGM